MSTENFDEKAKERQEAENEIDLLELAHKAWSGRRTVIKWTICGVVLGLIVAFSIPREYTTTIKLSPEITDGKSQGSLSSLAAMAGIGSTGGGADAVYPQLYPDVLNSTPFATGLFNVKVADKDKNVYTVRQYLEEEISSPWWSAIMKIPGAIIGAFRSSDEGKGKGNVDPFRLTPKESATMQALTQRVGANVDTKTSVITLSVTMQDPMVSAILADTVAARLQEYVVDYRTNKARKDLEYAEKLNEEAKTAYYKAQQRYADYLDKNQGIVLHSAQTTRERLENESQLAFNLYNQTAQRLQQAQAKVQETTPVFAMVEPPTVPVKPSKPSKAMILIGFTFLAFVGGCAWVIFMPGLKKRLHTIKSENKEGKK